MVRSIRLFSDLPRIPRSFVLSARRISPNLPWRAGSLVVGSARFQKGEESHCQDDFPCPGQLKFATWRNLSVLNNDPERRARPAINPVGVPFDPGLGLLVRPGVGDSGTGHFPAQVPAPRPQERERQPATKLDVPGFGPGRGGRNGVGPGGRLSGDRQACDAAIRRLRLAWIGFVGVLFRAPIYTIACLLLAGAFAWRVASACADRFEWIDRRLRRMVWLPLGLLALAIGAVGAKCGTPVSKQAR